MEAFAEFCRTWGMYGIGLMAVLVIAAIGLVFARKLYGDIEAKDPGNDKMREIAEMKMKDLNANDVEAAEMMIRGTARSMGITIQE